MKLLLPVSRHDFLAFLKEQDSLADKVEDLAMMLTVREFQLPKVCKEHECSHLLLELANYAVESTRLAASVIRKLNDLKDRGFSGELIEEMRGEAKIVGELEWKADKVQYKLLKEVLAIEEPAWTFASKLFIPGGDSYSWRSGKSCRGYNRFSAVNDRGVISWIFFSV